MNGEVAYACAYYRDRSGRASWIINAPPHVMLRLKRTFAQVDRGGHTFVMMTDTPEACRDLLWFLDRFPMEVQCRERLEQRAAEHRDREKAVAEVFAPNYVAPAISLAIPLRSYQSSAVDLALRSKGLLLGDDVGLGKTATAIGLFSDKRTLPAVVVTLTHLTRQWSSEIARFAPDLKVKVARTGKPEDLTKRNRKGVSSDFDVLVMNYHKLNNLADAVAPMIKAVIWDECQELRHDGSLKYKAARHIAEHAEFKLGLSATPIYNYGGEIWSVLDCISPDLLGTRAEFNREWCSGFDEKAKLNQPTAFGCYLRESGLMVRRTRSDVGRELAPLTRITQEIDSDLREIDKVADHAVELARVILSQGGRRRGEQLEASQEFSMRLRQATGIAKAASVAEFVRMLVDNGEKVLLYGFHHAVYELWRTRLIDLKPAFYTGIESSGAKAESIRRFTSGETDILIMSTRAGAGVDGLQQHCRTVVYGELDWSSAVIHQGIGRLYRDGQTDPVVAYFLVSDSGSDPIMVDVLGLKEQQLQGVINPDAPAMEKIEVDPNHIKNLAADFLSRRGVSVVPELEEVS